MSPHFRPIFFSGLYFVKDIIHFCWHLFIKNIKYVFGFEIVFILFKNSVETTIEKRSKGGKHYIIKVKNKKILIFNFSIDTASQYVIIRIVS